MSTVTTIKCDICKASILNSYQRYRLKLYNEQVRSIPSTDIDIDLCLVCYEKVKEQLKLIVKHE